MPGGKVVVFTGLKQCVTTEEELAAVVSYLAFAFIVCVSPFLVGRPKQSPNQTRTCTISIVI
jgi:hypothetical protein